MAETWIKMRANLADDPAVLGIAAATKLDRYSVVGRLHIVWTWADDTTTDGYIPHATADVLDEKAGKKGFAAAMAAVRPTAWLTIEADGLRFPNFCRHNGSTAKARALDQRRKDEERRQNPIGYTDRNRTETGQKPDRSTESNRTEAGHLTGQEPEKNGTRVRVRVVQQQQRRILVTADFPTLAAAFPGVDLHTELEKARVYVRTQRGPKAEVEFEFFRDDWLPKSPVTGIAATAEPEPCTRAEWIELLAGTAYGEGGLQESRNTSWATLPAEARKFIGSALTVKTATT